MAIAKSYPLYQNIERTREVMMARVNYLELPVTDTGSAKRFYTAAFGWRFADFGPTYAATTTGDTDIGFQADPAEKTAAALPVIEVADLAATLVAVEGAGGTITLPIFAFPGGRRFHFRDVDGHELAAMQAG
jgi:predicted enzyme related to lactoylglutathione lyase